MKVPSSEKHMGDTPLTKNSLGNVMDSHKVGWAVTALSQSTTLPSDKSISLGFDLTPLALVTVLAFET